MKFPHGLISFADDVAMTVVSKTADPLMERLK